MTAAAGAAEMVELVGPLALAAAGLALVVLALTTARPPAHVVPDRDGYFDRWQELHGGYDPRTGSVWLRGWLTFVHALARPLARRGVQPDVVTVASIWVALAVLVPAWQGGRWPLLAAWVLVLSGLLDTLDGCLAVLERRTTRWGYLLDSLVDRVNDVVYLVAVVGLGAPVALAVWCGVGFFLLEYARARAGNAGGDPVGAITVGERANRVIVLAVALLLAGLLPDRAGLLVTAGLGVLTALTAVGLVQLLVVLRRQLLALPADAPADQARGG